MQIIKYSVALFEQYVYKEEEVVQRQLQTPMPEVTKAKVDHLFKNNVIAQGTL